MCDMIEALLQGSEEVNEQPFLTVIVRGPGPEESELYVGLRDALCRPTELVQEVEDAGRKLVPGGELGRLTYLDEDDDPCTLVPETLPDALSIAPPGPFGIHKVLRVCASPAAEFGATLGRAEAHIPLAKSFRRAAENVQPTAAAEPGSKALAAQMFGCVQPSFPDEASVRVVKTFRRAPPPGAVPNVQTEEKDGRKEELEALCEALKEELSDAKAAQKEAMQVCKKLREELGLAKERGERVEELKSTCRKLQMELAAAQGKVERVDGLESMCKALQAEVVAGQGSRERVHELERMCKALQDEASAPQERVDELESTCKALQAELVAAQAAIKCKDEVVAKCAAFQRELNVAKDGERRMQEAEAARQTLKQLLELAQEREQSAMAAMEEANAKVVTLTASCHGLHVELAEARGRLVQTQQREAVADRQTGNLAASCDALRYELAEAHKGLAEVQQREAAAERQAEADRANLSAVVVGSRPLVLDVEVHEEAALRGDASGRYAPLLESQKATSVFCVGCAHFHTSASPSSMPACASVVLQNDGLEEWPETTAVVFASGESFGLSLLALGKGAPGEVFEVELDLLVPPRRKPGQAHGAWVLADAATGRRLGPLLVLEAIWDAPPPSQWEVLHPAEASG